MKAAQLFNYGGPEAVRTAEDVPKPVAGPRQVLIEVNAAAVNPFDWAVREGFLQQMKPLEFPATLGGDLAGVVVELGEGVDEWKVGDEVYGTADALSGVGSFAEFAPAKAEALGHKPKSTDFNTAAALPLVGCSAYQALIDHAHLQAGQKVLIHGGAGGIGSLAVQLAKHLGAYVAATAGTDDAYFVKDLGVDELIDFETQDFVALLSDYDVVFDTVGGETYKKSFHVLKQGGLVVSMNEQPDPELMKRYNVTAIAQVTKVTTERLQKIAELVDQGIITPHVDRVFPLEEAAEAISYLHLGGHRGKVVLKVT